MKNMKKKIISMLFLMMVVSIVACGKAEGTADSGDKDSVNVEQVSDATIGGKYINAFNASAGATCNEVVDELLANVEIDMDLVKMDVEPGYLNGFDGEIKNFEDGVVFAPMIGSIPFVGYVFNTSDAAALEAELKANANLRWNVCTEADEMVSATKGNLVFFMMCSNED